MPIRQKAMRRYELSDDPRFLTFSCNKRLPLLKNAAVRDLLVEHLVQMKVKHHTRFIAWVIMPEHVHLLLRPKPGEVSLVEPLWELKRDFAKAVIARWRDLNAPILQKLLNSQGRPVFWLPGGGHDRNIRRPKELEEKVRYTHWNPVARGLVEGPQEWRWSSARWYAGDFSSPLLMDRSDREYRNWRPLDPPHQCAAKKE